LKVVVVPTTTVAVRPGEANAAAVPVASGVPVHPAVEYSRTVEPASAVPWTVGVVLGLGEAGAALVRVTSPGGAESLT
jgi:hypothetical protein